MNVEDIIALNSRFVIFGAQVIAYGAYIAIKELTTKCPDAFVVSSLERYKGMQSDSEKNIAKNPTSIEGIPVHAYNDYPKDILIIVAVTELVQKEVVPMLKIAGYNNLFILTQHEENVLMSSYYEKMGIFSSYKKADTSGIIPNEESLAIYEVRNHLDKPLVSHCEINPRYEYSIQAGAELTEKRIAPLLDNTGINISLKNRQYCEMSATYWVWKNTTHSWKGIEHYRRHLLVSPEMLSNEVDVFLPLPYICYPNEMAQFRRFVSDDVYNALFTALEKLHPDELDEYKKILFGKYQYTYNLVCARREVFDKYCEWFFEITECMETMSDMVPEIKDTRALSYVAEVLTNLFFMSNQDKYRIMHVEKEIYI